MPLDRRGDEAADLAERLDVMTASRIARDVPPRKISVQLAQAGPEFVLLLHAPLGGAPMPRQPEPVGEGDETLHAVGRLALGQRCGPVIESGPYQFRPSRYTARMSRMLCRGARSGEGGGAGRARRRHMDQRPWPLAISGLEPGRDREFTRFRTISGALAGE